MAWRVDEPDADAPQSGIEAEADREDARMSALLDRIQARIEREGSGNIDFDTIYEEEKERLQTERGEPPPVPLTPFLPPPPSAGR